MFIVICLQHVYAHLFKSLFIYFILITISYVTPINFSSDSYPPLAENLPTSHATPIDHSRKPHRPLAELLGFFVLYPSWKPLEH